MKSKFKLIAVRFLIAVAVAFCVGPASFPVLANHKGNTPSSPVIPSASLTPLEKAVRHELLMLPFYGVFDNLEFSVEGNKVTLSGQVSRPILAQDAQRAVERISGVAGVINQVEVLPLSPFDDQIRVMTYRKIYGDSSLLYYAIQPVPPIRIIVRNGNVILKGTVSTAMDLQLAYMAANSVPGVFSVTNELRVQS